VYLLEQLVASERRLEIALDDGTWRMLRREPWSSPDRFTSERE